MKKRWMTVFCAVLFMTLIMVAADVKASAETSVWDEGKEEVYTEGAFTYYIHPSQSGEEAWIYKIEIQGEKVRSLSIPETIQGKNVTRLGCLDRGSEDDREAYATLFGTYIEPWHNWDGSSIPAVAALNTIRIPDTVEVIERAALSGLNSVTTIELPRKVKKIEDFTFYGCDKLKTIVLPEQMESFQNSSLWGCPSLKNIKLSKNNKKFQVKKSCLIRKKYKALVFAAATGKRFTIPNGIKKITSYAFGSTRSSAIHIPSSVAKMEKGAFHRDAWRENINIKDVKVSEYNRVFARDGQCIYKKSDKSLAVAIPDNKGELRISERVKKLTGNISLVNCDMLDEGYLEKVVYPGSLKRVIAPGFSAIKAHNVYFTGSTPPKVVKPKSVDEDALPVGCQVYVPKTCADVYKAWYKKNKCYVYLEGWHTYNP